MKTISFLQLIIIAILTASYTESMAQQRRTRPAVAKKKTVATRSAPPKKTVSDLLKEIAAARGTKANIKKGAVALPEIQKQRAPTMPLFEVKPPRSGDLFREAGTDEEKLEQITDQGIEQLYKLSQKYSRSKSRGELWLRLAELYVEKSKYIEYRLQNEYDQKLKLYQDKKGPMPKLNLSKSREYNQKAITLYEYFLKDFPADPKVDQAMFFLGYNYVEMDQIKKGVDYYQQLTKKFPNSAYVAEAHFALGEYYFDNDKWAEAMKAYSDVLRNRRARLYTFALYKIAWCQYRMGRVGQGLKTLEEVIRLSRGPAESDRVEGRKTVSRIRLGSETLKDIVLFYGDVGNYRSAKDYFYQIGGEKAQNPMLEKLAYLYSDSGRREQATYIFKQLLEINPTAPKAFDYQYQIVTNYSTAKDQGTYRQELYAWIDSFGPDSAWAQANKTNPKLLEDAFVLRESTLRNYTLLLHKNAQNSQKKPDLLLARQAYQLYLGRFPDNPKSAEMHFFFGELLYSINDFENAAKEYRVVADKEPKGKYFETSVLNALLALEKLLKSDEEIKKTVGESLEPAPFGEAENAFIAAANRYIQYVPRGERIVDVRFKIARLHYAFNRFDEAIKLFKLIVAQHPKTQYAVYSANLILDIYNLRKDYDGLSREGLALMKNRTLTDQGFQTDVRDLVEKANFKKAQDLELQKNYEGSAKAFDFFATTYPRSPLALSATYNAGINYERAQKFPEAIAMYMKVSRAPPTKGSEKIKEKSSLLLGRLYEQTAQYDKAAAQFERYAKDNPKDKITPDLYFNAAIIWEGQKEFGKAISNYQKYYDTTRRRDRIGTLFTIAQIYEKMGSLKAAQDWYERFLNEGGGEPEKVMEAVFKIADINEKRDRRREAEKGYRNTIATAKSFAQKGKPAGLAWAAEAKFRLTETVYNDFVSIRLPANPVKLKAALEQKLALLARLSKDLAEVIKYDEGNMVIASLTKLGQAFDHLGKAILTAPLPKDLNKEELEAYKKALESQVVAQQQKAVENYQAAIGKSYEINYYNKWTKTALDAMARYQPAKYAEPKEVVIPSTHFDDMGMM
jgi:cellulose synthase operon protein C